MTETTKPNAEAPKAEHYLSPEQAQARIDAVFARAAKPAPVPVDHSEQPLNMVEKAGEEDTVIDSETGLFWRFEGEGHPDLTCCGKEAFCSFCELAAKVIALRAQIARLTSEADIEVCDKLVRVACSCRRNDLGVRIHFPDCPNRPQHEAPVDVGPGSAWQRQAEENGRRLASSAPVEKTGEEKRIEWHHIDVPAATNADIQMLWIDTSKQPEADIIQALIVRARNDEDAYLALRAELATKDRTIEAFHRSTASDSEAIDALEAELAQANNCYVLLEDERQRLHDSLAQAKDDAHNDEVVHNAMQERVNYAQAAREKAKARVVFLEALLIVAAVGHDKDWDDTDPEDCTQCVYEGMREALAEGRAILSARQKEVKE